MTLPVETANAKNRLSLAVFRELYRGARDIVE